MNFSEWSEGVVPNVAQARVLPSLLPKGRVRIRDSFYTAPGYREIGMFYSCVPDPAYPWNPMIMREIRKLAPDAVPLWVHWVFMSPQETGNPKLEIFGRHALGRVIKQQRRELTPMRVLMPTMPCQGLWFERPNDIWFIHQGRMGEHPKYKDLPGDYLPFDHDLLAKVQDMAKAFRMTDAEYREHLRKIMIEEPIAADQLKVKQAREQRLYKEADLGRYLDKQYEKVSEVEAKEHYLGRGRRPQQRRAFVGSTPRRSP